MRKLLVVLGVPVDNLTMEEALVHCDELIAAGRATGRTHQIATVNADFVVNSLHDPELRRILQEADMSTADGMPLVWGSRLLGGSLPGRVTGADLVPALAERAAKKGYSIFFLGAREGVAAQAAEILQQRYPGLKVAGVLSPPPASVLDMDRSVAEAVIAARPDILFVAFGNPKQEKWIRMYAPELHVPIAIGIGGSLDMIVGVTRRAPAWMQRSGLEWIYRLAQEPKRLFKRYIHDFGYFGYFFVRQWWAMRRGTAINMSPVQTSVAPEVPDAPRKPEIPAMPIDDGETPPAVTPETATSTPVIYLRGRLDVSNQSGFAAKAGQMINQDPHLIINMAEAQFLDSSALGALVALANQARAAGGDVWLVEVSPQVGTLLSLVHLDRFFEIHTSAAVVDARRNATEEPVNPPLSSNGWAIVKMPRLVDADTMPAVLHRCDQLLAETPRLVLDFSETVFLASAGMAAMIRLDRTTRSQGGALHIAGCSHDVLRSLKLVKLDNILAIYPDLAAATAESSSAVTGLPGQLTTRTGAISTS